jgi:hypothetical protein
MAWPPVEDFVETADASSTIQRAFEMLEQTCPKVFECSNFLNQSGHVLNGVSRHLQVGFDHRAACVHGSLESHNFFSFNLLSICWSGRDSAKSSCLALDSTMHVSFAKSFEAASRS